MMLPQTFPERLLVNTKMFLEPATNKPQIVPPPWETIGLPSMLPERAIF